MSEIRLGLLQAKFSPEEKYFSLENQCLVVKCLFYKDHSAAETHWELVKTLGKKALSKSIGRQ